jgi:hypothetical protein
MTLVSDVSPWPSIHASSHLQIFLYLERQQRRNQQRSMFFYLFIFTIDPRQTRCKELLRQPKIFDIIGEHAGALALADVLPRRLIVFSSAFFVVRRKESIVIFL